MAVLEKIRVKLGIFITILIALALLSFIIDPTTLRSAFDMVSADNKVGEMDGQSVSYKDFYEEYENFNHLSEVLGQKASDEQAQQSIRDAAWQAMFDNRVFIPKAEDAGLSVGEEEMYDLTQGNSISPLLINQGMFVDQEGNFSREAVASFVQSIDADPSGNSAFYWNFLEETIFRNQLYAKYNSLIEKSYTLNAAQKARAIADNNTTCDVDYVFIPTNVVDSTVKVSSSEIRSYYNSHKNFFKQLANRDMEYVMFEVVPSGEDKTAAEEEFDGLCAEFAAADNLKNFVALHSDSKWNPYYFSAEQLKDVPEFYDIAFGKAKGVAVHKEDINFSAARVADEKTMSDSVKVFYKAFPLTAEASADSCLAVKSSAGFSELGWFTQEYMIQAGLSDFSPVFSMKAGEFSKVKSVNNQAYIILYVEQATAPMRKVQIATYVKNVLPSEDTYRDYLMKATELADASAGKYENFTAYVKEHDLPVIPVQNVIEATRRLGVVENAREVIRWVFEKGTKEGSVSDVIVVDNKYYFVSAVTKIRKEGVAEINDAAEVIRNLLFAEKSVDKKYAEVVEKIQGKDSLEEIADTFSTTVSHNTGISFGSLQPQNNDIKFIGAVSAARPGVITTIPGQIGVYVFKVASRQDGSFYTEADAVGTAARNASYQASIVKNQIASEADVKDNRARFF